jgi:hypothetical protein
MAHNYQKPLKYICKHYYVMNGNKVFLMVINWNMEKSLETSLCLSIIFSYFR